MCGHIEIGEQKDIKIITRSGSSYTPKSNGSGNPGSMLPVVTDAIPGKVQEYRWGLLTLDDNRIHSKNRHARIESLQHVPMWRELVGRKHCIIRIQAFFEYNREQKKTYRIERKDGLPFYIAGLWDIWFDIKSQILLPTCTMITMEPNTDMAQIHDRMPAIMERADVKTWLNGNISGPERINFIKSHPCADGILRVTVAKEHGN